MVFFFFRGSIASLAKNVVCFATLIECLKMHEKNAKLLADCVVAIVTNCVDNYFMHCHYIS